MKQELRSGLDMKTINNRKHLFNMFKFLGLVLIYFLLQYKYLNDAWFATDELDIMLGGKSIANGYQLYRDFLSQHMPFSYYISALFDFLGATTVSLQRISFYIFFATMWAIVYVRYKPYFNKKALLIYPLLFCSLIETYDMGTVIMSEHLAGIGSVILFLEYLVFCQTRKIHINNCAMLSLSIVLTFGTAFVCVFSIFFIVLGVIAKEIEWQYNEKQPIKVFCIKICKKYWLAFFCILLPWIILCGYYILTNNFGRFILSAYEMNRSIYSKYLLGYGDSILQTFLSIPSNVCWTFFGLFSLNDFRSAYLIYLIVFVLIICFFLQLYKKRGSICSIALCLAFLALSTRGCYGYHGTQWVEVASLFSSLAFIDYIWVDKYSFLKRTIRYQVVTVFLVILVLSGYIGGYYDVVNCDVTEELSFPAQIISSITEEGEAVWLLSFDTGTPMQANRAALYNCGSTPWFWEALGIDTLKMVSYNYPRVLIYEPAHVCWGNKLSDYAPELVNYIDANYTCYYYAETGIYIRNDYYEKALGILGQPIKLYDEEKDIGISNLLNNQDVIKIVFSGHNNMLTGFGVKFGTYIKQDVSDFKYTIRCIQDNKVYQNGVINGKDINDNYYTDIIFDEEISLTEDYLYELEIIPICEIGEEISMYITEDNANYESYLNGEIIEGDYNVLLYRMPK